MSFLSYFFQQSGGGNCSICGSPGTNKSTCPCNPQALNPDPKKHPKAKDCAKFKVKGVKTKKVQAKKTKPKTQPKVVYQYGPNDLYDLAKIKPDGWKKKVHDLWAQGLTYKGVDLFDSYMKAVNEMTILPEHQDAQEAYLGYDAKEDSFVSGWDWWPPVEEEEEEEEEEAVMGTLLFDFTLDEAGQATVFSTEEELKGLYGRDGIYDTRLKINPDMVDIRLD